MSPRTMEKSDGKTRIGEIRNTCGGIGEALRLRWGKRPRPGALGQGITCDRRRLSPHMDEERNHAGRTQAPAEKDCVIDFIIIAVLVLQVILERLF